MRYQVRYKLSLGFDLLSKISTVCGMKEAFFMLAAAALGSRRNPIALTGFASLSIMMLFLVPAE